MRGIHQQIIKQEKSFGLDISSNSVKALELRLKGKALSLVNITEISIPMSAYIAGVIRQPEIVAESIKKMMTLKSPKGFDTNKVICSLPDDKIYQHTIQMPSLPSNKMESALELKIPSIVPMPVDNIYWDWTILETLNEGKEVKILITAVEKETLDSYVQTLKFAGLDPIAFETSQTAALRVIKGKDYLKNNKIWCIIGIGKSISVISLVYNGTIEYSTSIHFGTNQLYKIFGEYYNITNEDEIEFKILKEGVNIDEQKDKALFDNLNQVIQPLYDSVSSILSYYATTYNQSGDKPMEELIIYGEGATINGLTQKLTSVYNIPSRCADNTYKILPGPQWIQHQKIYPFLTVLGLAIAGKQGEDMYINLLPKDLKNKLKNYYILSKALFFTKISTLNLIVFAFLLMVFSYITMTINAQYINQIQSIKNILSGEKYSALHDQVTNLNTQLKNISDASTQQYNWIPVLSELGSLTPKGVILTNFSATPSSSDSSDGPWIVTITGNADTRDSILLFQKNLEGSKYFTSIELPISDITTPANIKFYIKGEITSIPTL